MLYNYNARTPEGETRTGTIEAPSLELAISSLQRRSWLIVALEPVLQKGLWYTKLGGGVSLRDIVLLSRQLATLFEAKVPVIDSLKILGAESLKPRLQEALGQVSTNIQGGSSISQALTRHPDVFSNFYVNMVRSGEESGKLEQTFLYLADYMERNYDLISKARNALIYPAIILVVFIAVITLMMVVVIPQISSILLESGAELPVYTRIVLALSDFLRRFGIYILLFIVAGAIFLWRYSQSEAGKFALSRFWLDIPLFGVVIRKFYISRLADNLQTLLAGGVTVLRALELSADVVGNQLYARIVRESSTAVKAGVPISEAFSRYEDVPPLMTQMIKIGEETGKLDFMLKTLARFYRREVDSAVDNLVGLIEPILIVVLGIGVFILIAAVLLPIYNLAAVI